ncbi:MAG: hypothetical protein ABS939_16385 [Psychrobacillus sp.]
MEIYEAVLEVFKILFSIFAAVFTFENLKELSPYLLLVVVCVLIGNFFGLIFIVIKSFFQTGIGQFVLLIGLGVVAANVWIF